MRISDWSSDVCSSDLKKKTTFIVSTWPELKITSDLCAAGHSITGEDKKRIGKLLQLDASLKCFSVEPIAEVENVSIFSISRSWDERSEEHTSELQSLMRISYAGFCLKKNNIQLHS